VSQHIVEHHHIAGAVVAQPFLFTPEKNSRLKKAATLCRDLDARLVVVAS
jgi:hypothetical protein